LKTIIVNISYSASSRYVGRPG